MAKLIKRGLWILLGASVVLSVGLAYYSSVRKTGFDEKSVSSAEDKIYEAVVRDMVSPIDRQKITQLVFDDSLITELAPESDVDSCKERARNSLHLESGRLPYDTIFDKAYRLFTRGVDDAFLHADTIQNFLERYCTAGRLSQTFHTDLPRKFIARDSVYFDLVPTKPSDKQDFRHSFPGAPGIISFSHVGFDRTLDEAIVSTSFVCGSLCGDGSRFVLKKIRGRWEVVNKWVVWVS